MPTSSVFLRTRMVGFPGGGICGRRVDRQAVRSYHRTLHTRDVRVGCEFLLNWPVARGGRWCRCRRSFVFFCCFGGPCGRRAMRGQEPDSQNRLRARPMIPGLCAPGDRPVRRVLPGGGARARCERSNPRPFPVCKLLCRKNLRGARAARPQSPDRQGAVRYPVRGGWPISFEGGWAISFGGGGLDDPVGSIAPADHLIVRRKRRVRVPIRGPPDSRQ